MSLNWNCEKVKNYKELCWVPDGDGFRVNPVTETLIFRTMLIGMNQITEKNFEEFSRRLDEAREVFGPELIKMEDGKPVERPITLEDVRAHIGLGTNASRKTKRQWASEIKKLRADKNAA